MIYLLESDMKTNDRQSSKGNQLKWRTNGRWYKADYTGYEGMAEYIVSSILQYSSLSVGQFVPYRTEEIMYNGRRYLGCSSPDFMRSGSQLITWERLYRQTTARSLQEDVFQIDPVGERLDFLIQQLRRISGISEKEISEYLAVVLTVDALFLNEDRHMHNLAFLLDDKGIYHLCPLFDHGGCLLSDTSMDYPIDGDIYRMIKEVPGRTISRSLDDQLDAVELLQDNSLSFHLSRKQAMMLIEAEPYYPEIVKKRVTDIVLAQMEKYAYLFMNC